MLMVYLDLKQDFVDDFKGVSLIDIGNDDCDCAVDSDTNTLEVPNIFGQ